MDKQSAIPELVIKSGKIKILNYDCNTNYTRYQHRPPRMVDLVNNTIRTVTLNYQILRQSYRQKGHSLIRNRVHARSAVDRANVQPESVDIESVNGLSIHLSPTPLSICAKVLTEVYAQHNENAVDILHLRKWRLFLRARAADEVQGIEYRDSTTTIDQTPNGRREHNILMKKKTVTIAYRTKT